MGGREQWWEDWEEGVGPTGTQAGPTGVGEGERGLLGESAQGGSASFLWGGVVGVAKVILSSSLVLGGQWFVLE